MTAPLNDHPLPASRRAQLRRYRVLARFLGGRLCGKVCSAMYRAKLARPESKTYYVLSTDPLVLYLGNVMQNVFDIAELLKHRRVHFVKNFYHTCEREDRLQELSAQVDQFHRLYPQHTIHFLCATEREREMFADHGIERAHFINKNALVDEGLFRVLSDVDKEFDAIHNGQLAPYKRHELAEQVESLALIVYRHPRFRLSEQDQYVSDVRTRLRHARWFNDVGHRIRPAEIPCYLNRARVGLCLSSEEGPMAASMEYLLCGLPIVSTRSLGGRDVFFDPEYVEIVEDDPAAVAEGVRKMVRRKLDPECVRQRTLQKISVHRERFIALIERVLHDAGSPRSFRGEFERLFTNKMRLSAPFPGVFVSHACGGMPVETCRRMALVQTS